ncbi:MAG: anaerobic sulfite reductase subunit AsrA [Acetivibrio ethanolgignens]
MGYQLTYAEMTRLFSEITQAYDVWAPVVKKGEGCFSDTDVIRYEKISSLDEVSWEKKSDYSFKEALLAINETLFYFTEDKVTIPAEPQKELLIFLRSCDLHGVRRLDQIYLKNGFEDFYYARVRRRAKFILMGCSESCQTGFCVSMGTNQSDNYDAYIRMGEKAVFIDTKDEALKQLFSVGKETDVEPDFVTENHEKVTLPKKLSPAVFQSAIWEEYGERCIACGRCNFVCPTCTCFTTQDIFYRDNKKVGERRRVWASCQVDGYSDIAGGHGFRQKKAERVRFKVMHKICDYEKRFGYHMCVGCGRCDAVCPEYISYSNIIHRLAKEEEENEK